ncbi:MAG: DUF4281 domain-containing protein [Marinicaulis sp.]|nr:DUF4281 domain-containing protein [Marinicaulis sp.]NNE41186.1 DUF4281 domain-containing protein [Marinicaulis sp.]NNL87600.1 DUF4281 domain-containing protein [Marinicaulis sp.]
MNLDLENTFSLAGNLAMVGWALLAFGPRRWGVLTLTGAVIPSLLAILYGALMFIHFADSGGGYGSLAEVRALFGKDELLLAGWVHYLAFDLAVGAYIAAEADRAGLSRLIQFPFLVMTLMFGPVGFLLFQLTRVGWLGADRLAANRAVARGAS